MKENIPYYGQDAQTPTQLMRSVNEKSKKKALGNGQYVYKVGKIQENNILCEKQKNDVDFRIAINTESRAESELPQEEENGDEIYICNDENLLKNNKPILFEESSEESGKDQIKQKIEQYPQKVEQEKKEESFEEKIENEQKKFKVFNFDNEENDEEQENKVLDLLYKRKDVHISDLRQNQEKQEKKQSSASSEEYHDEVKGIRMIEDSLQGNVTIKIINKYELLNSQLPVGIKLICKIRKSSNFISIINPQFDLFLSNGLSHIASAKKYPLAKRQIYRISTEMNDYDLESDKYVGSINTNSLHNSFWILQPLPKSISVHQSYSFLTSSIIYEKKQKNKERLMRIFFTKDYNMIINKKTLNLEVSDIWKYTNFYLQNQNPKGQLKEVKQNKNSVKSTKNCSIYDPSEGDYEFMKLTKESDHFFQLQIQHPFSPLQAFALALTRFDAQLS